MASRCPGGGGGRDRPAAPRPQRDRAPRRAPRDLAALIIAGPTASGKSSLARDVAEEMRGVVVNADSVQLYRELEILSARPPPEDMARVPHRLYGVLSAREPCSAGRWRAMALEEMAAAAAAGRLPVLVGGTGMYHKALIEGLAPVPAIPDRVRAAARALHARLGSRAFHAELCRRDAVMAARLGPGDTQRVIRAYEVVAATGRSLADWQEAQARAGGAVPDAGLRPRYAMPRYAMVVLEPPRADLYAACDRRFGEMVARGAVDEVRRLEALGLDPGLPAMKAVGVPELCRHLRGELTLDEACALARRSTRRYAKRQLTWFRHQAAGARRIPAQYSESLRGEIFSFIRHFLLTGDG